MGYAEDVLVRCSVIKQAFHEVFSFLCAMDSLVFSFQGAEKVILQTICRCIGTALVMLITLLTAYNGDSRITIDRCNDF